MRLPKGWVRSWPGSYVGPTPRIGHIDRARSYGRGAGYYATVDDKQGSLVLYGVGPFKTAREAFAALGIEIEREA